MSKTEKQTSRAKVWEKRRKTRKKTKTFSTDVQRNRKRTAKDKENRFEEEQNEEQK